MSLRAIALAAASLLLAGCVTRAGYEPVVWANDGALGVTAAQARAEAVAGASPRLSQADEILASSVFLDGYTACLAQKNRQGSLVTIGNYTVTAGDVVVPGVAAALAKVAGSASTPAALLTIAATQLKLVQPLTPPSSGFGQNMSSVYAMWIGASGFAAQLNGPPAVRATALSHFRGALQQACAYAGSLSAAGASGGSAAAGGKSAGGTP